MDSFQLHAIGNLARDPELLTKGDTTYVRFSLIGNDYAGRDEEGGAREVATTVSFVAFGAIGEAIARVGRTGDQMIVEARIRSSRWTDKEGDPRYGLSHQVLGFRMGAPGKAKRALRAAEQSTASDTVGEFA